MNIAIVLSGGSGLRFGSDIPKQYHTISDKEVIGYVFEALEKSEFADEILIVAERSLGYKAIYAPGGKTHNESVSSAIAHIKLHYPTCEKAMFVDAVRPLIPTELVDRYFRILDDYDAVITTQYVTDSLGKDGIQFIDRSGYYLIQKPEAFRFQLLAENFKADSPTTAIVQQLPIGTRIYKNFDFVQNLKITYPIDIELAEQIIKYKERRGAP